MQDKLHCRKIHHHWIPLIFFCKHYDINAYKRRLAGFSDDEFYGNGAYPAISNDGLIRAQSTLKRNKELSILVTVGLYILNIVDANVDAHLLQYNLDDNLSLRPNIEFNEVDNKSNFGISLNIELWVK